MKKLVERALARFGFELVRVEQAQEWRAKAVQVKTLTDQNTALLAANAAAVVKLSRSYAKR